MGELADMVKKRSPFLKIENGESIVATYKGFRLIPSTYDPEKEVFRFLLQVTIEGEVTTKYWDTGSNKVAMVFDQIESGDRVKITKNVTEKGGKESTSWDVVAVAEESGDVTKQQAEDISEDMAG